MSGEYQESTPDEVRAREESGQPVVERAPAVMAFLRSAALEPAAIIETDGKAKVFDLSRGSMDLGEPLSGLAVERFCRLVNRAMASAGTDFAYGRWGERRDVYNNALFAAEHSEARREVHLGIDVFCAPGTPVVAPLDARVHVKANNARELDYGPMLILTHETPDGHRFHSLFGHLALASIEALSVGQRIAKGEAIAAVGAPPENGNWAPHLHFQLILDLLGLGADFPGVAYPSQQETWLRLSPLPDMFFPDCDAKLLDGRDRA